MRLDAIVWLVLLRLLAVQAAVIGRDNSPDEEALLLDAQGDSIAPLAINPFSMVSRVSTTTSATTTTTSRSSTISASRMLRTSRTASTPSTTSSKSSTTTAKSSTKTSMLSTSSSLTTSTSQTTKSISTSMAQSTASAKLVFAHHIVGNTYNYNTASWVNDITLAASKGIDAFALNIGSDSWEQSQVASAYAAAKSVSSSFKLFISFDMTSLPCSSADNAQLIRSYITSYASHPNQLLVNGNVFISAFAGESCTFGTGSVNQGWINTVKTGLSTYFVPSFFVDPATFPSYTVLDGAFGWNSGWPMGDYDINFDPDQSYISNLGGRSYMAAVSPWFFTHYGADTYNKNFIYRGDDWLLSERWELLVQNRDAVSFVEVNTWNDYGESHYVGPIEGEQPMSQAWVNGFDHQGWLDLIAYYITAYKTGAYPSITRDRTFLWARLYPAAASSTDSVGKPTNWQWTEDYLWAVVQLTSSASVTLTCGSSSTTVSADAGTTKLKLPFPNANCNVVSSITRGSTVTTFAPSGFQYQLNPPSYNFNAFVAASP